MKAEVPEYTLKQSISIYEMVSSQYWQHVDSDCEQCVGWFAEGPHCEEGNRLMRANNKWIERMESVAKMEGVTITLPTPISEEVL